MLRKLEEEGKEYHIVGDLNCNLLDTEKNIHSRQLTDIMDIYQLKQIITEPTRITTDTASLIDVFITNSPQKMKSSGVIRLGKHTPWLTNEIKKHMNNRDYLKQKAIQTKSRYSYEAYKIARNKTNKIVEKAKSRYFQHTINNNGNDPKQLWKGVNLIRGKGSKTTNITSLEVEEETITGDKNIYKTR